MGKYAHATATVFNIVHGSFVDGWGIRTTIFLKGCPLRCKWCCNPEGQQFRPELRYFESHCNGCGRCVSLCSKGAIRKSGEKITVDRRLCDGCGECVSSCYYRALGLFGQEYTVDEIFAIVQRDTAFYRNSGGGVTIGGGEATRQPKFCLGLMERCHEAGIPVAIDTCGYITTELGMEVLRQADLLLFDIKGLDSLSHLEGTGVPNDVIWHTLEQLEQWGKDVIVRLPIIPGYANSDTELVKIAEKLSQMHCVKRCDILPFHEYGKSKYAELGMEYPVADVEPVSAERQARILDLFREKGLTAQIGG